MGLGRRGRTSLHCWVSSGSGSCGIGSVRESGWVDGRSSQCRLVAMRAVCIGRRGGVGVRSCPGRLALWCLMVVRKRKAVRKMSILNSHLDNNTDRLISASDVKQLSAQE